MAVAMRSKFSIAFGPSVYSGGFMWKAITSMTVLTFIATVLLYIAPGQGQQKQTQENNALAGQPRPEKVVPAVTLDRKSGQPNPASNANNSPTKAPEPRDPIATLYYISGPLAFIASVGTGILVWRQIKSLRVIERAQIDLDLTVNEYSYTVLLSNHGRTIGILTAYKFIHAVYPIGATDLIPDEALVKFEDTFPLYAVLAPKTDRKEWMNLPLAPTLGIETIRRKDVQIIISGFVEYRDIFNKPHETEVVYRYTAFPLKFEVLWEYGSFK